MNRPPDRHPQRPSQDRTGRRGGSQRPPPREVRSVTDLWGDDYLRDGYFDADENLRLEFVSREKMEPLVREMARATPALTTGQLRRFFQHCRRVEARLRAGEDDWAEVRSSVVFLDAAAQDAVGKSPKKIPELFFDFIRRNIGAVQTEKDFVSGFLPHFEALVGFGSTYLRAQGR